MTIATKDQFLLRFNLGDKIDFIQEEDFFGLTIIEEAGNFLPTFELAFSTNDESVVTLLNEGNVLELTYGVDENNLITTRLAPMRFKSTEPASDKINLVVKGFYSAIDYLNKANISISDKKSGVEVIKDVVSNHFVADFNIDKSEDSQNWIQPNIADKNFVENIWLRSYLADSFIAIGISVDGKFILKDVVRDLETDFKWRFVKQVSNNSKDIEYDGDIGLSSDTGIINSWHGYTRIKNVYSVENGTTEEVSEEAVPVTALSNSLAKKSGNITRHAASAIQTENTHDNYHRAYMRNVAFLSSFSNISVVVSFVGVFKSIRVLDKVMLKSYDLNNSSLASQIKSGIHYVSKVSRTISRRKLTTTVKLSREALNQTKVQE